VVQIIKKRYWECKIRCHVWMFRRRKALIIRRGSACETESRIYKNSLLFRGLLYTWFLASPHSGLRILRTSTNSVTFTLQAEKPFQDTRNSVQKEQINTSVFCFKTWLQAPPDFLFRFSVRLHDRCWTTSNADGTVVLMGDTRMTISESDHHLTCSGSIRTRTLFGCEILATVTINSTSWFLLNLFLRPWRWRRYVPPKRRLTLNGLHCVISQKIVLFITTAVRTSNLTQVKLWQRLSVKLSLCLTN
jgi:hypothetical protein